MKYFIPLVVVAQLLFIGCSSGSDPDKVLPSVKEDPKLEESSNSSGQSEVVVQEEQDQSQVNDKQEDLIKDEEIKSTEDQNETRTKEDNEENEIQEELLEELEG